MASEQAMALYRKLNSSGTAITTNNWREWDRLASSAMKMPDFTPPGQSESLHDLANEVGIEIQALKSRASRPGAPDTFAVEDRFYFSKGRKERFADDVYLDPTNARHIAHYLDKIVGSMKPMGESRMDAAVLRAIGQLTKIKATLLAPKFVSTSTLKTMRSQVEGFSKQFQGLYSQYSQEATRMQDQRRLVEREHRQSDFPRDAKAWVLSGRRNKEMADLQKNIEKLDALFHEAWRIKHALQSLAHTQMQ